MLIHNNLIQSNRYNIVTMSIKSVQNEDLLYLARIEKELFNEDAFGVFLLLHYLHNHIFFDKIVSVENEIIGFGILSYFDLDVLNPHEIIFIKEMLNNQQKVAHLVDFAVRKKHWRQGYGTTLLNHFESRLIEKQFEQIYLEVDSSNYNALNFYKNHHFREIGTIKSYYSTGHNAILMVKQLEIFSEFF